MQVTACTSRQSKKTSGFYNKILSSSPGFLPGEFFCFVPVIPSTTIFLCHCEGIYARGNLLVEITYKICKNKQIKFYLICSLKFFTCQNGVQVL